jgi:hypothetical protein
LKGGWRHAERRRGGGEPEEVEAVLAGIPGAFERAQAGARQAAEGDVIALDELARTTDNERPGD